MYISVTLPPLLLTLSDWGLFPAPCPLTNTLLLFLFFLGINHFLPLHSVIIFFHTVKLNLILNLTEQVWLREEEIAVVMPHLKLCLPPVQICPATLVGWYSEASTSCF